MAEQGLLLVHAMAPPHEGGTAVVLHRLLRALGHDRLEVMTDRRLRRRVAEGGELVLPARYRYFPKLGGPPWAIRAARETFNALNVLFAVAAGLRGGLAARSTSAGCVLSVADGGFSQIAGAVAARAARRPHMIMVFDVWEENAYSRVERWLARRLERLPFRHADAVVVYCEAAARHYRHKHGIECRVIAMPIESPTRGAGPLSGAGRFSWRGRSTGRRKTPCAGYCGAAASQPDATVTMIGDEPALRGARPRRGLL